MTIKKIPWIQILNPFYFKPLKQVYNNTSIENKALFWNITMSFLVALFTAWLGFTVSKSVQTNTESLNTKLLRYQVIDKFSPSFDRYQEITLPFINEIVSRCDINISEYDSNNQDLNIDKVIDYFKDSDNVKKMVCLADSSVPYVSEIIQYVDVETRTYMMTNNFKIISACYTLNHLNDSIKISKEQFSSGLKKELLSPKSIKACSEMYLLNSKITDEIIDASAELYDQWCKSSDKDKDFKTKTIYIQSMILIPCVSNYKELREELYINEKTTPVKDSIIIFLIVLFFSYILYRIVIIKAFIGKTNTSN